MLSRQVSQDLLKLYPRFWDSLRRSSAQSQQSLETLKKTGASLKLDKKPNRPPFMKNVFLGVYDMEMLVYPELDKPSLEALKKKIEPYKNYFNESVDSQALSVLKMIPNEIKENFKNLGLFGQIVPLLYGGADQTATETALINEIVAKDLDIALTLYSHNFLSLQTILKYGSTQQKQKYLPLLASGDWTSAFCISEENISNSDIACILTKVVPSDENPDLLILNGKKQWVTNGSNANLFVVLAKMDFKNHVGKTIPLVRLLLIERESPGVSVTKPQEQLGLNGSGICEVQFHDTPVHSDCFVGGETRGFEMCAEIMNSGRYNIGAITLSVLKNLLHIASESIINKKQSGKNLIEHESIQDKVAEIATCIYSLESMTYLTTGILDKYEDPDCSIEQAIIKVYSFTEGRRCLDMIMDLMGGRAFWSSEAIQKYFRDFRTLEMFDGTTDIAKLFISLIGLQYAGITMNESVAKMRFPFEYPTFVLKRLITTRRHYNDKPKLTLGLFEQLHPSLTESANELEYCVHRFQFAVSVLFNRFGADVIDQQIELMRLADAAVKIYAMTAVLGRASRSYCIGLRNAETEVRYAKKICTTYKSIVQKELNEVAYGLVVYGEAFTLKFGSDIFRHHGYYVEHPTERSY